MSAGRLPHLLRGESDRVSGGLRVMCLVLADGEIVGMVEERAKSRLDGRAGAVEGMRGR